MQFTRAAAIRNKIRELETELKTEEEAEGKASKDAAKAIHDSRTYEWRCVAKTAFIVRVERRLSEETWNGIKKWEAEFPEGRYPYYGMLVERDKNNWEGMEFYIIEGYMLSKGGGTVILIEKRGEQKGSYFSSFDADPLKLTEEELRVLGEGGVPDSLKRPM